MRAGRRAARLFLIVAVTFALQAIGGAASVGSTPPPIGRGSAFHPPPSGRAVDRAAVVSGLRCTTAARRRVGAHVEVFAARQVVLVPAGIGIAPPRKRDGGWVRGGRCAYPLRTTEPTGVVELDPRVRLTLGHLFDVWGQPLSRNRLGAFRARGGERVEVFVAGRRRRGDPRSVRLRRHSQIVLEIGGYVRPHRVYHFARGL